MVDRWEPGAWVRGWADRRMTLASALAVSVGMAIGLAVAIGTTHDASSVRAAAPAGGPLTLAVRGPGEVEPGAPLALELVVTNNGDQPCRVSTALTAPVVTGVTRNDRPVPATVRGPAFFTTGLNPPEAALAELPAGGTTTLALATAAGSLVSVSDLQLGAGTGLLAEWSLDERGTYQISATLAPTAVADCAPPQAAVGRLRVADPLPLALVVGVVAVVLVLLAMLLLRRRRTVATAAIVLALGGGVLGSPAPAAARITPAGNPNTNAAVAKCITIFEGPGGDPAGIYKQAKDTSKEIEIVDGFSEASSTTPKDMDAARNPNRGSGSTINYFPGTSIAYDGVTADDCSTLYHELAHAVAAANGQTNTSRCPSGVSLEEARASLAENAFRRARGLPQRTGYNGKALPKAIGECQGPKGAGKKKFGLNCEDSPCAESNGDPHLRTWDDLDYDLQSVGEFVLARSDDGSFEVQARQVPYGTSRSVSVNQAFAARVGGQRVVLASGALGLQVSVDGEPVTDRPADVILGDGGRLELDDAATEALITWPDGSAGRFFWLFGYGVDVDLQPAEGRRGTMTGLFGDFDGDPGNDLRLADGTQLPDNLSWEHRHGMFADSWRVTEETSLFDYAPGTSTETFTDRTFPDAETGLDDLGQADFARVLCEELGVPPADGGTLDDCAFDLLVTGQAAFAAAPASRSPASAPEPGPDASPEPSESSGPVATAAPRPSVTTTAGGPISPGDTVRGVIQEPNERHVYTFSVEPRDVAYFEAASDCISQDLIWYLTAPGVQRDGGSFTWPMCLDLGRREFVDGGDFEIVVEGDGNVGPYEFTWVPVKRDDRQELVFDETMSGSIDGLGERDVYTFEAVAGDTVEVTGISCDADFAWSITFPSSAYYGFHTGPVCGESEPARLDFDGEYELAIGSPLEGTGRYSFEVTRVCRNC